MFSVLDIFIIPTGFSGAFPLKWELGAAINQSQFGQVLASKLYHDSVLAKKYFDSD